MLVGCVGSTLPHGSVLHGKLIQSGYFSVADRVSYYDACEYVHLLLLLLHPSLLAAARAILPRVREKHEWRAALFGPRWLTCPCVLKYVGCLRWLHASTRQCFTGQAHSIRIFQRGRQGQLLRCNIVSPPAPPPSPPFFTRSCESDPPTCARAGVSGE